jgi:hypothetical protein
MRSVCWSAAGAGKIRGAWSEAISHPDNTIAVAGSLPRIEAAERIKLQSVRDI